MTGPLQWWRDRRFVQETVAKREHICSIGKHSLTGNITMIEPERCGDPPMIVKECHHCPTKIYYAYVAHKRLWERIT